MFDLVKNNFVVDKTMENEFKKTGVKVLGLSLSKFVIGVCVFQAVLDEAQISYFVVEEKYRRKGFGSLLMSNVVEQCQELGINKLFLEVSKCNLGAEKFYRRFHFLTVGIRKNYYKDGSDALLKEKELGKI